MSEVIVKRWGKQLAIPVPAGIAAAASLQDGDKLEMETLDGDIVVRRPTTRTWARAEALAAAAEIVGESRDHDLGTSDLRA